MAGVNFNPPSVSKKDKDYIKSGRWKCELSPTGAHYWIEMLEDGDGEFSCSYCKEIRKFKVTF